MLRTFGVIRDAAGVLAQAAEGTLPDLRDGLVEQEPAFTDRMLGRIAHALDGYKHKGIVWRAKTFTDRGRGAQEARVGADFMGVLQIDVDGFSVRKGFLAQAKLVRDWSDVPRAEFDRMKGQCETMLRYTPAAYVFIYSPDSIHVIPAMSVVGVDRAHIGDLYSRSIARFYEAHFASFIGDHRLSAPNIDRLEEAARERGVNKALALAAAEAPKRPRGRDDD